MVIKLLRLKYRMNKW